MSEQLPLPGILAAAQGPVLGPKSHLGPEVDKAVSDAVEGMKRSTAHTDAMRHALDLMDVPGILAAVQGPPLRTYPDGTVRDKDGFILQAYPHANLGPHSPGVKHDAGKPDWYIMPWDALSEVQAVLDFGAKKYHEGNWHRVEARRYFSAAMRHMLAWRAGRDKDDESGLPHLAHAISCLLFILGQELKETQHGNA